MSQVTELRQHLKALLRQKRTLIAPGAYDAYSAMLVEKAGFELVYIGSYAASAGLGLPDVGLLTMFELVGRARAIADAVNIPVIADAENGFYNAASVWRSVHAFENSGVCGIHIDDHESGKHSDLARRVLPLEKMVEKIKAALEAREDPNFLIIARTESYWATGDLEDSVRRMNALADAGADLVFAMGLTTDQLGAIRSRISSKVVIVNTPPSTVDEESKAGADIVLYHTLCLFAASHGVNKVLKDFKETLNAGKATTLLDTQAAVEDILGYRAFNDRAKAHGLA